MNISIEQWYSGVYVLRLSNAGGEVGFRCALSKEELVELAKAAMLLLFDEEGDSDE